jgi:hypothetical protein
MDLYINKVREEAISLNSDYTLMQEKIKEMLYFLSGRRQQEKMGCKINDEITLKELKDCRDRIVEFASSMQASIPEMRKMLRLIEEESQRYIDYPNPEEILAEYTRRSLYE